MRTGKAAMAALISVTALSILPVHSSAQSRGVMHIVGHAPASSSRQRPLVGTALYPNFAPIRRGSAAAAGLGLDYDHGFPVNRTRVNRYRHIRGTGYITPIFFPGDFPLYDYDYADADAQLQPQRQPQEAGAVMLQGPSQGFDADRPSPLPDSQTPDAQTSSAAPETPVKDVGEFILVRRDGQVVLAVAFTTSGDRLTYITREGLRQSFPLADLDDEATRQMNDANGTTLNLPG